MYGIYITYFLGNARSMADSLTGQGGEDETGS